MKNYTSVLNRNFTITPEPGEVRVDLKDLRHGILYNIKNSLFYFDVFTERSNVEILAEKTNKKLKLIRSNYDSNYKYYRYYDDPINIYNPNISLIEIEKNMQQSPIIQELINKCKSNVFRINLRNLELKHCVFSTTVIVFNGKYIDYINEIARKLIEHNPLYNL